MKIIGSPTYGRAEDFNELTKNTTFGLMVEEAYG
jgi:hypothetical protein